MVDGIEASEGGESFVGSEELEGFEGFDEVEEVERGVIGRGWLRDWAT